MSSQYSRVAVYTGSFDPVTLGHLDVIQRSSRLVEKLYVGIGINLDKTPLLSPDERIQLVREVTADLPNVEVLTFSGLAVSFVKECGSHVMIRGVRPLTDIAGEFTMMMANRQLDPNVETVFLMADEKFAHVSSTLIKQIASLSNDQMLARFVPAAIIPLLRSKIPRS